MYGSHYSEFPICLAWICTNIYYNQQSYEKWIARDSGIKWYNNIETRETVSNLDELKFLSLVFLAHTLIVVDIQNR